MGLYYVFIDRVLREAKRVLVEREDAVKLILATILARGHALIEGVPGVAKTLTVKTVAKLLGLSYKRVQMTPDLLPGDIIGSYIYDQKTGDFRLRKGPIFTNILLVDEINRASPRTQSALLEAMQEKQVTIEGTTIRLEEPFVVLATQNPIEYEGVFPLPEAQLDRFLVKIEMGYLSRNGFKKLLVEADVIEEESEKLKSVVNREAVLGAITSMNAIYVDESIYDYIVSICEATRKHVAVKLGASPRAGIALLKVSKAMALMEGRKYVIPDDVKKAAIPALSHRILIKPEYEVEGVTPAKIIGDILVKTPIPKP